jgi:hypothetical protein
MLHSSTTSGSLGTIIPATPPSRSKVSTLSLPQILQPYASSGSLPEQRLFEKLEGEDGKSGYYSSNYCHVLKNPRRTMLTSLITVSRTAA